MNFRWKSSLSNEDKEVVFSLWNSQYPENIKHNTPMDLENDFINKFQQSEHLVLSSQDGKLKGWIMVFMREKEEWFSMIIDPSIQGKGFGSDLLSRAKEKFDSLNGWIVTDNTYSKVNGEKYRSPLQFYVKNGFTLIDSDIFKNERIICKKVQWKSGK